MAVRPRPHPDGGWMVRLGSGTSSFGRDGFADAAAAEAWAAMAAAAVAPSTIRIGPRRILASMAEALRRWAIDQGTLPEAEGGTHVAPLCRLADLMRDPLCLLPLAAVMPDDLVALRRRRTLALGGAGAMLVEQATLAAAIDALRALHLPRLSSPFLAPAADGLFLPEPPELRIVMEPLAHDLCRFVRALGEGLHLDEVMVLAGLHAPG